jgi:hypothetical protein
MKGTGRAQTREHPPAPGMDPRRHCLADIFIHQTNHRHVGSWFRESLLDQADRTGSEPPGDGALALTNCTARAIAIKKGLQRRARGRDRQNGGSQRLRIQNSVGQVMRI